MKSLKELSAQLEERTYHALPYLSYSIIARYEREGGFKSLPEKWKDLWQPCPETEALLIGSAVDCLVTAEGDREEAFNKEFIVVDIDRIPDKSRQVVDTMLSLTYSTRLVSILTGNSTLASLKLHRVTQGVITTIAT